MYKILNQFAKEHRKNMPKAERLLWQYIRKQQLGVKFLRQKVIKPYIVDFYCAEFELIIELDGEHHIKSSREDYKRDVYLKEKGYTVLRFWNYEVESNLDKIINIIKSNVSKSSPNPP